MYNVTRYSGFGATGVRYGLTVECVGYKRELGKMLKRVLLVVALIVVAFSLFGCQTVQGLGQDVEWVGQKGAEAVDQE